MAKILKGRTGAMSEHRLMATVRGSGQQIWLAGLGAFSTTRREGNKVFEALVREGEAIQSFTQKAAKASLKEAGTKAAGTRRRLGHLLENSVARAMRRFGVPTRGDLDTLSKRLVALTALIEKMTVAVTRKQAAAKHAASGSR